MADRPHILFAGGGSLGHIYPGLAIAERLSERVPAARVTFVGDGRSIEQHTVRGAGFGYTSIPCSRRPRGVLDALRYATSSIAGSCASLWLLGEMKASLVVGLGGYASAAMLRGAMARRTPTVIVEPNCIPTPATRRLSRTTGAVCLAFEESRPHLPVNAPTIVTGVPGRPRFERPLLRVASGDRERLLVVIGGAGGSKTLNEATPEALRKVNGRLDGWRVVHQSGEGQLLETERRYRRAGVDAVVVTYIDEMADLLRVADMVVCPSGGCTLAELSLSGAPGLLVPDHRELDDSQAANARLATASGGCQVVETSDGDLPSKIAKELGDLLADQGLRDQMSRRIASWAKRDAASKIAAVCCDFLVGATPTHGLRRAA